MRKLLILRRLLKGLKFRFELILLVTNLSGIKEIKVFLTMMNFTYMAKLFLWRFMHYEVKICSLFRKD